MAYLYRQHPLQDGGGDAGLRVSVPDVRRPERACPGALFSGSLQSPGQLQTSRGRPTRPLQHNGKEGRTNQGGLSNEREASMECPFPARLVGTGSLLPYLGTGKFWVKLLLCNLLHPNQLLSFGQTEAYLSISNAPSGECPWNTALLIL